MKKVAFILLACISVYAATYDSITAKEDTDGVAGFKNQFLKVGDEEVFDDILLNYNGSVQSYPIVQKEDSLLFEKKVWCTQNGESGVRRIKFYIPPYLDRFKLAIQNVYLGGYGGYFLFTYKTDDSTYPINESTYKSAEYGFDRFNKALWRDHETVGLVMTSSTAIGFTKSDLDAYGVDNTKGGYLYVTYVQALPEGKVEPRLSFNFVAHYKFIKPLTSEMKSAILSRIPLGKTEPIETQRSLINRDCGNYLGNGVFEQALNPISVEEGEPIDPQQACESQGSNYQYIDSTCYDTSSEKYTCEISNGGRWSGRCITPEEDACNASSLTHWYVGGSQCLYRYDHISNASGFSETPKSLTLVESGSAAEVGPFQANEEGWLTQLTLTNSNTTAPKVQHVTIKGHNGVTVIDDINFTLPQSSSRVVEISKSGGRLFAKVYDESGIESAARVATTSETNGTIFITPLTEEITLDMVFGNSLNSVDASQSGGGSGGSDNVVISTPTTSSSSSTGSTGGSGSGSGDAITISRPTTSSSSSAAAGSGGDNLLITGPTSSSSSTSTGSTSSSVAAYNSIVEKLTSSIESFEIAGWLYHYDFSDVNDDYDYVYLSRENGKLYRLKPTTGEDLKWESVKGIRVDADEKRAAFVLVGDWDKDGKGKNDWVIIDVNNKSVYRFLGNIGAGKLGWDSDPLPVSAFMSDTSVIFQ